MAQCPQCADSPLVHAMLAEGLPAYSCGKCLGTLISLVTYRAWRESTAGRQALQGIATKTPDVDAPDSIVAKNCPKCRSLMSKYRFSAGKSNRLDYCPHCEEIWLDDGEWQLVEGLAASGEFAKVFTQAWQSSVIASMVDDTEKQRQRELLGPDFARVGEFAEWLRRHPQRAVILAMISRNCSSRSN